MSRPIPWWATILVVVALTVIAIDTQDLPGFPHWVWAHAYGTVAVALVVWRITLARPALLAAAGVMFVASFARATAWLILAWPERAAGVALNAILALEAIHFVTSQHRWRRDQ